MSRLLTSVAWTVGAGLVWVGSATADEKGGEQAPSLAVVGTSVVYPVVPDLDRSIARGERRLWTKVVVLKDATFLKAHFVDLNLRAGDTLTLSTRDLLNEGIREDFIDEEL